MSYDIACMWNLKKNKNVQMNLFAKQKSQMYKINLWLPREKGGEG